MKRLICLALSLILLNSTAYSFEMSYGKKLLIGSILTVAGVVMAMDGFTNVKEDISKPSYAASEIAFTKRQNTLDQWYADLTGKLTNTGNVDLDKLTVGVKYYDSTGNLILVPISSEAIYRNVKKEEQISWMVADAYCGPIEPITYSVSYTYDYTPIFQTKQKSTAEGVAGVISFGIGVYMLINTIKTVDEFSSFMDKHNIDIKVTRNPNTIGLLLIKRI